MHCQQLFFDLAVSFFFVSVSDVEENATGWPSCSSTAPTPTGDASTETTIGLDRSNSFKTGNDEMVDFRSSKAFSCWSSQTQAASCFKMSRSGRVITDKFLQNLSKYVTIPNNRVKLCLSVGAGMFTMASTF